MALRVIGPWALVLLILMPWTATAQSQSQPPAASGEQLLKAEELDQLVSPIALYPDNLLSQVLIASTYPLEVVQADRWVKDNKSLKGEALKTAAGKQGWDDSIKSLTAVPDVLNMMSSQLDWTQKFEPVSHALEELAVDTATLDGELVVEGDDGVSSFSLLQQDLSAGRTDRMVYYVFDLLYLDGVDLRGVPLEGRKAALAKLLRRAKPGIRYAEHMADYHA